MQLTLSQTLPSSKSNKLFKKSKTAKAQRVVLLVNDQLNVIAADIAADASNTADASDILPEQQQRAQQLIELTGFKGKVGETLADFALPVSAKDSKHPAMQMLLVGIGNAKKTSPQNWAKIAKAIHQHCHKQVAAVHILVGDALQGNDFAQLALALLNASYQFDKYKSETSQSLLTQINFIGDATNAQTLDYLQAVYAGQALARDVANEPGNVCYPEYMAAQAKQLAKAYPDLLKVSIIDEKKMQKLGMNCFLAVSQGSEREGKLVILEYQGMLNKSGKNKPAAQSKHSNQSKDTAQSKSDAPIVLVGKGVTFDTGGISLKPGAGMDEMKFDMGGSASVLGTIKALCEARLPIHVVGALACAENMPSGKATRPGDIVTAMNGKSVEILNTDAEGRLVLCDTLCYVQRYQPKAIIDVATLTGACVIALGHVRSAVYANDEDVLFALENASEQSGDLIWHMPMDDAYQSQLDSPIADMQNIGGRDGGSITAACFLSRFVEEGQAWAHLDVAGTAWQSGKEKGATGRPVPLFMQYLKNACGH